MAAKGKSAQNFRSRHKVMIGNQFDRWCEVRDRCELSYHYEVAKLLLDSFERLQKLEEAVRLQNEAAVDRTKRQLQNWRTTGTRKRKRYSGIMQGNQLAAQKTMDTPSTATLQTVTYSADTEALVHRSSQETSQTAGHFPVITIEPSHLSDGDTLKQSDGEDCVKTYYVQRQPTSQDMLPNEEERFYNGEIVSNLISPTVIVPQTPDRDTDTAEEMDTDEETDTAEETDDEKDDDDDVIEEEVKEEEAVEEEEEQEEEVDKSSDDEWTPAPATRLRSKKARDSKRVDLRGSMRVDLRGSKRVRTLTCALCSESFANRRQYISHVAEHSEDEQDSDYKHDQDSDYRPDPQDAEKSPKESPSEHLCDVCCLVFETLDSLEEHRSKGHEASDLTFECPKCSLRFATGKDRYAHISRAHKLKPCKFCDSVFETTAELKAHRLEETFPCAKCGKVFKKPGSLRRHMLLHSDNRTSDCVCELCKKVFRSKGYLAVHMRLHQLNLHPDQPRPFQCETCGKTFKSRENLGCHIRSSHRPRNHLCQVCGKAFRNSGHLAQHEVIHLPQKPYECDICHKRFPQKPYVKIHKRKVHPEYTR